MLFLPLGHGPRLRRIRSKDPLSLRLAGMLATAGEEPCSEVRPHARDELPARTPNISVLLSLMEESQLAWERLHIHRQA